MSWQMCDVYPNGKEFICRAAAKGECDDVCHGRKLLLSFAPMLPLPPEIVFSAKSAKIIQKNTLISTRKMCFFFCMLEFNFVLDKRNMDNEKLTYYCVDLLFHYLLPVSYTHLTLPTKRIV